MTALSLEGYQGVLSYGFRTSAGDEYSATSPLKVRAQELLNNNGQLVCQFDLFGLPDQLDDDEASVAYTQTSSDTQTIKTLFSAIAGATLAPYTHCTAITVTYDSEDSLIDTFIPADYFRVYVGESRLAKLKWLLAWTKCVMRFEADGAIHISSPVVSGTTYDYEYEDAYTAATHPFFSKVYRTRLVLPNKIIVQSSPDHSPSYTGNYTSAASYALLPKTKFRQMRLASDAQATAIATALIQKLEQDHAKGSLFAPMNVGAEVYDYVKVTDNVEGDNRVGNLGYLTRNYEAGKFDFFFGFGSVLLGGLIGTGASAEGGAVQPFVTYADFNNAINEIYTNMNNGLSLTEALISVIEQMQDSVPKWHVTEQLIIPVYVTE